MWSELNLEKMAAEENTLAGPCSAKEVEELSASSLQPGPSVWRSCASETAG